MSTLQRNRKESEILSCSIRLWSRRPCHGWVNQKWGTGVRCFSVQNISCLQTWCKGFGTSWFTLVEKCDKWWLSLIFLKLHQLNSNLFLQDAQLSLQNGKRQNELCTVRQSINPSLTQSLIQQIKQLSHSLSLHQHQTKCSSPRPSPLLSSASPPWLLPPRTPMETTESSVATPRKSTAVTPRSSTEETSPLFHSN